MKTLNAENGSIQERLNVTLDRFVGTSDIIWDAIEAYHRMECEDEHHV